MLTKQKSKSQKTHQNETLNAISELKTKLIFVLYAKSYISRAIDDYYCIKY